MHNKHCHFQRAVCAPWSGVLVSKGMLFLCECEKFHWMSTFLLLEYALKPNCILGVQDIEVSSVASALVLSLRPQ
jgi:hypothetical protein